MSRIGKLPVKLPNGVKAEVGGDGVVVKGPKGALTQFIVSDVDVTVAGGEVVVTRRSESRVARANHGLMRALVNNMVRGVSDGFERKLQIEGTGFRAEVKARTLVLTIGFSHPVVYAIPVGIDIAVEKQVMVSVRGADRQQVGQVAAIIRGFRPPDSYKGKGIRYFGEQLRIKEGKSA